MNSLSPAHRAVYEAAVIELPQDLTMRQALLDQLPKLLEQIDDLTDYMGGTFPTETVAHALILDALTIEHTATGNAALQPLITRHDRIVRAAGVVGEEEYEQYMDSICTWYDRHAERAAFSLNRP